MKEFIKDYKNFWAKEIWDENHNRLCKRPFLHYTITCLATSAIAIAISIYY